MILDFRSWRKAAFVTLLIFAVTVCLGSGEALAKSRRHHPRHTKKHSLPVARGDLYSDIVIEARTGRILHTTNANQIRYPASLTKMMTLYITFQALEIGNLRLDQRLPVSSHAAAQSPSKLGLKPGQSIRVQDAILSLVTESANDAAVVLGEAMGGSEERFAQLMTKQAKALGMKQTVFQNASGLPDPDQVTTARDMAVLAHALVYHYPKLYSVFGYESFTYAGRTHHNHNHLMERYEGMDGIKTGYVRASGFNLVASAVRGNRRLIGVVFGGRSTLSRDNQMADLLDQGFASDPSTAQAGQAEDDGEAQGDSNDPREARYITLPSRAAALFLPRSPSTTSSKNDVQEQQPTDNEKERASSSSWGIQIGAYNDSSLGQQALSNMARSLAPLLNKTNQILQKAQVNNGAIVYRARFMGMGQSTARSICAYIAKRGQDCVVVPPEPTSVS